MFGSSKSPISTEGANYSSYHYRSPSKEEKDEIVKAAKKIRELSVTLQAHNVFYRLRPEIQRAIQWAEGLVT